MIMTKVLMHIPPKTLKLGGLEWVLQAEPDLPCGFRIMLFVRPDENDFYDLLYHSVLFEDRHDAECVKNRIARSLSINLAHWVWNYEPNSRILPKWRPTAELSTSLRPSSRKATTGLKTTFSANIPMQNVHTDPYWSGGHSPQHHGEYWGLTARDNQDHRLGDDDSIFERKNWKAA